MLPATDSESEPESESENEFESDQEIEFGEYDIPPDANYGACDYGEYFDSTEDLPNIKDCEHDESANKDCEDDESADICNFQSSDVESDCDSDNEKVVATS